MSAYSLDLNDLEMRAAGTVAFAGFVLAFLGLLFCSSGIW